MDERDELTDFNCKMRLDGDVEIGKLKLTLTASEAMSLALGLLVVVASNATDARAWVTDYFEQHPQEPI